MLSTVNNTVYDVIPEIGRKSKMNITFSMKVCHDDSSEGTLLTFKEESQEGRGVHHPPWEGQVTSYG